MTKDELNNRYFDWMYQMMCDKSYPPDKSYRKLLCHLRGKEFTYTIPMDTNRAADGIDLRYRFGDEHSYEQPMIATYLDDRPCSVLEMLIALAVRCEEQIMDNPDIGDRTSKWFWDMIVNLGLGSMTDSNFSRVYTDDVIFRFLNRKYRPNGDGGLFTIENCKYDLRTVEIWYQLCWYLNSIL